MSDEPNPESLPLAVLHLAHRPSEAGPGALAFYCPGCEGLHVIYVNGEQSPNTKACWGWNGSMTTPTFTPSYLVHGIPPNGQWKGHPRCHSFITEGKIQYLSDCEHRLAGKTVQLPVNPTNSFDKKWDDNGNEIR
jgi:uncharacterized protein DUF6527